MLEKKEYTIAAHVFPALVMFRPKSNHEDADRNVLSCLWETVSDFDTTGYILEDVFHVKSRAEHTMSRTTGYFMMLAELTVKTV